MATIPSRTRSLRKPADNGTRLGRPPALETKEGSVLPQPAPREKGSQSPSRLPTTTRTTRSASTVTTSKPLNASVSITNKPSAKIAPTRTNTSRPPSTELQRRPSLSSRTGNPTSSTEPVKKDRSRPPLTQSRHLRNVSTGDALSASVRSIPGHTRNKSSSTLLSTSTAFRPDTPNIQPPPQSKKPAFSTHQQHFSPAKSLAPKPNTAAILAPPSPSKLPSNIAISADTAKLQNELLQLHLLHKDAAKVERQWRASAAKKLGERFQEVVDRNDRLVQSEVDEMAKVNAATLKKWQESSRPGWGLGERIQLLDEVVTGVWNLGEPAGKYARIVRKFEKWLSKSQRILAAREKGDGLQVDDDAVFLEELDSDWRDDCLIIGRKLESWREQIRNLEPPDKETSLATVVDSYRSLVKGMLVELNVMTQIERDVMAKERAWITSMNDDITDDEGNTQVAGACWRAQ